MGGFSRIEFGWKSRKKAGQGAGRGKGAAQAQAASTPGHGGAAPSSSPSLAPEPEAEACPPVPGTDRRPQTVEAGPGRRLHLGQSLQEVLGPRHRTGSVKPDMNTFFQSLQAMPQVQSLLGGGGSLSAQDIRWRLAECTIRYLSAFNAQQDPAEKARMATADPLLARLSSLPPGEAPANLSERRYFKTFALVMSKDLQPGGSRRGMFSALDPIQKTHVVNIARDQGAGQGTEKLVPEAAARLLGLRVRILSDSHGVQDGRQVPAVAEEWYGPAPTPEDEDEHVVEAILVRRSGQDDFVEPALPAERGVGRSPSLGRHLAESTRAGP